MRGWRETGVYSFAMWTAFLVVVTFVIAFVAVAFVAGAVLPPAHEDDTR